MVLIGHLVWIKLGLTLLRVPACGRSVNKARLVKVNWSYHQTPFGSSTGLSTEKFLCFFALKEESIGYTHTNKHLHTLDTHKYAYCFTHTFNRPWNGALSGWRQMRCKRSFQVCTFLPVILKSIIHLSFQYRKIHMISLTFCPWGTVKP